MRSIRHKKFEKKVLKLPKKLKVAVAERLDLFLSDPHHPLLDAHALSGEYAGRWSFNVTGDWRLIYRPITPDTVLLLDVDTHHNLYGT
jgi:addiction module RelE/StbE family toxin